MTSLTKGLSQTFFSTDARNAMGADQTNDGNTTTETRNKCRHRAGNSTGKCGECKTERSTRRRYRWRIILGLVLPYAVSSLDVTIVASALPWIAADFDRVSQLNWIVAAFNLTAAAFIPFWGQMADVFGRHVAIQGCMIMAIVGGAVCTGAPTSAWGLLLFGRAVQGIGCAGMNVVVRAIVADRVSLQEDAKNWSIFSVVAGMAFGVGPIIGGYLTSTSWRWCFGITLPVGVLGCVVVWFVLGPVLLGPQPLAQLVETTETGRRSTLTQRLATVDIGGQVLCMLGFGLLILALTWAGATFSWASPTVLVPLIIGLVTIALFTWWQRAMAPGRVLARKLPRQQAMIPWEVLRNRDIGLLFFTSAASGMAMYSVLYFCVLYFTLVKHLASEEAGRALLLFVPGIGVGVLMAIFMCNTYPRQTWHPIMAGAVIQVASIGVMPWAMWHERDGVVYGMLALAGVGVGIRFVPVPLHGMGYFPQRIAAVISLMEVSDPFGGTLGLTIMTTVFNNVAGLGSEQDRDFAALSHADSAALSAATERARAGIAWAFVSIIPFMVLCLVASAFLGNVYVTADGAGDDERENVVYQGVFLWALVSGEKIDRNSDRVRITRRGTHGDGSELPRTEPEPAEMGEVGR